MKKIKTISFFILSLAIIIGIVYSRQCDDKCKQGYPYSSCNGNLNLYRGLGYDGNGNVIFSGKYNSSQGSGGFGLPSIFSVPSSGGCQLTKRFDIHGEILDGPGYTALDYFYKYLPQLDRYYVRFNQRGSPIFSIYNQTSNEIKAVFNIFNTPFVPAFSQNESNPFFVYGGYGIYGLAGKYPTDRSDAQQAKLIYQSQIVNGLEIDGDQLYMTTYQGQFLKGSLNCLNCTKDQLQLLVTDSELASATSVSGFVLTSDYMYYSYSGGIKGYPKNGDASRVRKLVSENVVAMISNGDFIYYQTDSGVVKSVSTTGNHPQVNILYTPVSDNQCQCSVGFSGDDCRQCDNGMVLWASDNGIPICSPLDSLGKPKTCYAAYQCGSSPFIICNGTCTCLPGFSGNDCTLCGNGGEIIWENGYPTCVVQIKKIFT
ncbi:hypothetical protein ACTFIZ_005042 [Dictyostelium cf. discoideum]